MPATPAVPRIALTPGEPAGVGPELCLMIATREYAAELVVFADRGWLADLAHRLNLEVELVAFDPAAPPRAQRPGEILVHHAPMATPVSPGHPDPANAHQILECLGSAVRGNREGVFNALVTGPIDKGVICESGIGFTGHTGHLAQLCGVDVVMMLASPRLRVALATDHLPLRDVPDALTPSRLQRVLEITHREISRLYRIANPRLLVCGLNPHAGEGGHLGDEDETRIRPVIEQLRASGMDLVGPLPADSLFTSERLQGCDGVIAMYHDQGLPVLKYQGFGEAVNITLGLPFVRTSVDHGTAYPLAGTARARPDSLHQAIMTAIAFTQIPPRR